MTQAPKRLLNSLADIKRYFAENEVPYYFVSATNFNLMGMHEWVRGWEDLNMIDCFDGRHPQVVIAEDDHSMQFESIEDINAYVLNSPKVRAHIAARQAQSKTRSRAIFLFFNEQLEAICEELDLDIILPKFSLVHEIDSKIVTTEIGNQAGVSSVPNVLTRVKSYADLQQIARKAGLGERWVVQSSHGDSGKTTYFIASEADYRECAEKIEAEEKVKVMRWIRCTGSAIEACATRWGTVVGPLLTELIGAESLTAYAGGWCGNELYAAAFSMDIRRQVQQKTHAIGDVLYQRGYRGYFELDFLIDLDTNDLYLGELNARITGISAMTNMSDFSVEHIPLFLFHLLEYDPEVDLNIDIDAFNQAVLAQGAAGTASQVILNYTEDGMKIVTEAPVSGVYTLEADGHLKLKKPGYDRREALAENEAYVLRIMGVGEYTYLGADLAIMFMNGRIRDPKGKLNPAGEQWVGALKSCYQYRKLDAEELSQMQSHPALSDDGAEK
jgi:D-alanine-D-alanine ligase-like ATP-grasp enzyme